MVQIGFDSIDQHAADCQIIRLNDANLHEYLDLPDFVATNAKIPFFATPFLPIYCV